MYAFASRIILVGVPLNFIGHDFQHFSKVNDLNNIDIMIKAYNKIITSDLTKIYKEMLILYLWINIHEIMLTILVIITP